MVYIILFYFASLFALYIFLRKKTKRRIKSLEKLIDDLSKKDYRMPMVQDDFSLVEDKIYKIFLEIVEAREEIEKNSKKQVENLENIAHQIKTPMTSMFLDLETIEKNEKNYREIERLNFQLERLNSLADCLLKLSSLDANTKKMEKRDVFISEIIDYALDILEKNIEEKNIEIEDNTIDLKIKVDYYWVCEAVINILKNAINIENVSKVKLSTRKNPIYTELLIEDDGGGIKKEEYKKIFDRFYKSPDSNGFGIGLSMAKTILENNNGDLTVENGRKGAMFSLKFYNVT